MSNTLARLTANDDSKGIMGPDFWLFPDSKRRTWKLRNSDNTLATMEYTRRSDTLIDINVEASDDERTQHRITTQQNSNGWNELTVKQSTLMGNSVSWQNGLVIPTTWYIGNTVTATSIDEYDSLSGKLIVKFKLRAFAGESFSVPEWFALEKDEIAPRKYVMSTGFDSDIIRVTQVISSQKTGAEIAKLSLYFAAGVGIVRADGRIISRTVKYFLEEVSD